MLLLDLVQNLALLVAMAAAYRILSDHWEEASFEHRFTTGLLFGGVAVLGMMTPVQIQPGLIFDGRSIVLGVAGLVGGPLAAFLAAAMAGAFRLTLGGVGTVMGVLVIAESAGLGAAYHLWRRRTRTEPGLAHLWLFGVVVHGIMALLLFTLPGGVREAAWAEVGIAILGVYPVVMALTCRLFMDYERRDRDRRALQASEARYRTLVGSLDAGVVATDTRGWVTLLNSAAEALTGWKGVEALGVPAAELLQTAGDGGAPPVEALVQQVLQGGEGRELPDGALLVSREGDRHPVAASVTPVRDSQGRISGTVVVVRDQTRERAQQREVRESRERLELIVTAAGLGTWDWHIPSGDVTYNRRWSEILGYRLEELEHTVSAWSALVHPKDLPRVMAALDAHLQGRTDFYETEHRLRHRSGGWVWVLDWGRVVERDSSGRPVRATGTHLDITQRKEAEEALRKSESRFRLLAENAPDLIYRFRLRPERGFEYVSPAATAMTGYTPEEHYADPELGLKLVHPDDRPLLGAVARGEEGMGEPLVLRWVRKDGEVIWTEQRNVPLFDEEGELVALEGIARDITRQREEARSHRILSRAVDQTSTSVVITELDGRIEYVNPAFERLTGYTLEEVRGQTPRVLKSGRQPQEVYDRLWAEVTAGGTFQGELVNRRKDGSEYHQRTTIFPMHAEDGTPERFVGLGQDVTQEKILERQFRQAQKMQAVGQLAGGIAHDFNNLLTAILVNAQFLESEMTDSSERGPGYLKDIMDGARRGSDLVRRILTLGRPELATPTMVDVAATVDDVLRTVRRVLPESIEISVRHGEDPLTVFMDEGAFTQAILNLASNARDAMPEGGRLTVRTRREPSTVEPDQAPCAVVEVSDTGAGMDAETRGRVFEPFFTTKEVGQGTGLGLTMVYGFATGAQGTVEVASEPGKGATFTLRIPLVSATDDRPAPPTPAPETRSEPASHLGGRVLLAEDQDDIRRLVTRVLERMGLEVTAAGRGDEALALLDGDPERFDLVLADLVMPGGGGTLLYRHAESWSHPPRFLFMSGYASGRLQGEGQELAHVPFLQKPFTVQELEAAVRRILDPVTGKAAAGESGA